MTIRMIAATAVAIAAAALSGCTSPERAATPTMDSALHADYVLADPQGQPAARFEWVCEGASCSTTIAFPGVPPASFTMDCEETVCTFSADLAPEPLPIDLGKGFEARSAGAAAFESDLGRLTIETVRGVTHADIPRPDLPAFQDVSSAFSGWGDWGAFVISHVQTPLGTFFIPIANSAGQGTDGNPAAGTATWSGIVGAHTYAGDHVQGDADLTADFAAMTLDVGFTGMTGASGATYADLNWEDLAMEDGGFAGGTAGNSIEGRFYGPNGEEAGGIFERDAMVGGFHAIRSAE